MRGGPRAATSLPPRRDSAPDYVLDLNQMSCSGGLNGWCGSRGCSLDVLLSRPDRSVRMDKGWMGIATVEIVRAGDRDLLVLGSRDGVTRHRWNGRAFDRVR